MKKRSQWEYVKSKAERVNDFIARGFLVARRDEEGGDTTILSRPLVITEANCRGNPEVVLEFSPGSGILWYEHSEEWDHGFDWTLEEIDRLFDRLVAYSPASAPLFRKGS